MMRIVAALLVVLVLPGVVWAQGQRAAPYPFEGRHMFFGLSLLKPGHEPLAKALDISWVSLQPHLVWFAVEKAPGQYDWRDLDGEIRWLQSLDLDVTMSMVSINAFGEQRKTVNAMFEAAKARGQYKNNVAVFIHLMREERLATKLKMYPHGETLPLFLNFVRAAVDRYDGDGANDMPGLRYEVRNWHFEEEYPMPNWPSVGHYLGVLKQASPTIKRQNPNARVIIPGLAGNFGQIFAFADGFIADEDAGVWRNGRLSRWKAARSPAIQAAKADYEAILRDGKDFFDVVDIHLYEPKETFIDGKLDYLKAKMREYGVRKPIWVIEGGGPFRNAPGDASRQGNAAFGTWTPKENAEYVVKLFALSAAKGVERQHWGLGTAEGGYWQGPWRVMGLVDADGRRKPSYYAYKIMREKVRDFTQARDRSAGGVRVIEFDVPGGRRVLVAWAADGRARTVDLTAVLQKPEATLTFLITATNGAASPVLTPDRHVATNAVPVNSTPVFVE